MGNHHQQLYGVEEGIGEGPMVGQMDVALYNRARTRAWRVGVWSALTGRSRRLFPLAEVDAACTVHTRRYSGMQTVPISRIGGSEGRSNDFDNQFWPITEHTRDRWVNIALAMGSGTPLPPVQLIRSASGYVVRDGHHRISVARALGQEVIEAEVV